MVVVPGWWVGASGMPWPFEEAGEHGQGTALHLWGNSTSEWEVLSRGESFPPPSPSLRKSSVLSKHNSPSEKEQHPCWPDPRTCLGATEESVPLL